VGDESEGGRDDLRMISALGLDPLVNILGRLPHKAALQQMRSASLLLLLAQGQPDQIPAKAFEYLASGRPILAVTGEGATADLIRNVGGSVVPDDTEAIRAALYNHYVESSSSRTDYGGNLRRTESLARFDRSRIAGDLASILDRLTS
jgi:glycosyltransferase involved in cell wall biosynthesis